MNGSHILKEVLFAWHKVFIVMHIIGAYLRSLETLTKNYLESNSFPPILLNIAISTGG